MLVCVGIPTFDGKPCHATVDSLLAEQLVCAEQGVHLLVQWEPGIPYVAIARNRLARRFLDVEEAACMVMVDADVSWPPGTLLNLVRREHDVIGGTYRTKQSEIRFLVGDADNKPERVGNLWKVDGLPGGFVKISRKAFETIKTRGYLDHDGNEWKDYFPTGWLGDRYYQEDYGFCWLWRLNGGEVWLDPSLNVRHHSNAFQVFEGDAVKWMDENYGAQ